MAKFKTVRGWIGNAQKRNAKRKTYTSKLFASPVRYSKALITFDNEQTILLACMYLKRAPAERKKKISWHVHLECKKNVDGKRTFFDTPTQVRNFYEKNKKLDSQIIH